MQELRAALVKKITVANCRTDIENAILAAIVELRSHWVCKFSIALFIDKLIKELKTIEGFDEEELFSFIRIFILWGINGIFN
jgi:hypothetical protein